MSASHPFRRLFRIQRSDPARVETEVRDEIAAHVRLAADRMIASGVPPAEAEARARARFDDIDATMPVLYASARQRDTDIRVREWFGVVRRDLVFAVRQFRRAPMFAAGVVLCLGFGIGSSATVYSWMEGMVLRPLPAVPDAERLVTIRSDNGKLNEHSGSVSQRALFISEPEYRDWARRARSVSGLAAASLFMFGVEANPDANDGRAEPLYGMFASANYFDVVGVRPSVGRAFVPEEDVAGRSPVVVISNQLWQSRFASSPSAIGKHMLVNGYPATIIGVAPAGFGGTMAGVNFDLWVPLTSRPLLAPSASERLDSREFRWLDVIGRLTAAGSIAQADAEFKGLARLLAAEHVENQGHTINVEPLDTGIAAQLKPLFVILIALSFLVVVIVCSNVANLLLVRAASRSREIGMRLSLGATRQRIIGQLMTESVLLAVLGAVSGIALTFWARGLLSRILPATSLRLVVNANIDWRVLTFVLTVTSAAVVVFGLVPALRASRVDLSEMLKSGGRGASGARSRTRSALVVAQFALSLTALVCGAVFLRRSQDLQAMDRGYSDAEHVLLVQTNMAFAGLHDLEAWQHMIDEVTDRARALPGVTSASVATFVPLGFLGPYRTEVTVEGYAPQHGESMRIALNGVLPRYFDLMGIRLLQGRVIADEDGPGRPATAVVNEAFVRQFSPNSVVLGRVVQVNGRPLTIAGVVKDGKYDYRHMDEPSTPLLYYALRQSPSGWVTFHVRTAGDPLAMIGPVRDVIHAVAPNMPIVAPTTLAAYAGVPMFPSQLGVSVLGVLGAAALVLAAMGLYSVIAYGVSLRSREIGIRLALGATRRTVVRIFVLESAKLLGWGVLTGTLIAVGVTWVLHSRIGLPMPSAIAILGPAALLTVIAMVAGFLPARRSATIDLARTLRAE